MVNIQMVSVVSPMALVWQRLLLETCDCLHTHVARQLCLGIAKSPSEHPKYIGILSSLSSGDVHFYILTLCNLAASAR